MKIVLDTNVLVSALINPKGMPAKILNMILNGKLITLYDNRIMGEYRVVLSRKKFNFPIEIIEPLLDFIKYEGEFIASDPLKTHFTDEDDKMFLELAISGNAEYLITVNTKHFPAGNYIVTPKVFIEEKAEIDA
jgi:putative PIN family toxin of toxin-antitoxin system